MVKIDDKYIQDRLDECQSFHYTQSAKVSQLIRTIVFGIIGTIWIVSYNNQVFKPANDLLMYTLCLCFIYIITDIIHYFVDACCYRWEYFRLDKNKDDRKFVAETHEEYMTDISKRSSSMVHAKFYSFIAIAILFIFGFVEHYNILSIPCPLTIAALSWILISIIIWIVTKLHTN